MDIIYFILVLIIALCVLLITRGIIKIEYTKTVRTLEDPAAIELRRIQIEDFRNAQDEQRKYQEAQQNDLKDIATSLADYMYGEDDENVEK